MKTVKISILMLALIAFTASSSFAAGLCDSNDPVNGDEQACTDLGGTYGPGNSTPGDVGGGPGAPSGVPIDGGASFLLAAGIGSVVKRYNDRKKSK